MSKQYYSYLHKQPSKAGDFSQQRKGRVVVNFYLEKLLKFIFFFSLTGGDGEDGKVLSSCEIYNYICNRCISPLTMWSRILLRWCVLDTTLCDKSYHWLAGDRWFSPGSLVACTNNIYRHDIAEILLKVALNTIIPYYCVVSWGSYAVHWI